jgi:hypothetical protein
MNDEQRDPELEWIRSNWRPPEPSQSLPARVLTSYRSQIRAKSRTRWIWWVSIPAAAATVLAFITLSTPAPVEHYRAVSQPRFIVVSQGEHP